MKMGETSDGRKVNRDPAYAVDTVVVEERRQWHVEIVVVFEDEVVRRRVGTYFTERRAQIAADLIKRTAERDISGPIHG
ncbi:hypothetical protein ACVW00_003286 [Marmoricola sp. URHA0025 HA25]